MAEKVKGWIDCDEGRGETWYLYAPEDILPMIERWAREAEG